MGWEAQWYFSCNWRVMCRWIDEAGGEELIGARMKYLKENGYHRGADVRHVKGWSAERLNSIAGR